MHESKGIATPFFDSLFDLNEIKSGNDIAGASKHTNDDPKKMDFDQLQQFRNSQREFSKEPVDNEAFIGSHERNEPYIDGGLFLMNYIFSLTYYGLASCILNTMLTEDKKAKVKKILDVSSSESLIGFVAAGYPKDDLDIANSARKPVDEVLKIR